MAPIGNVLDQIYGESAFAKAQHMYSKMFIYIPDVEDVYSWDGQLGGIEGQEQYFWDKAYINQIYVAMKMLGYPCYVLVKGDDCRVVILIPPQVMMTNTIDRIQTNVVTHVSYVMEEFGHKIKIEDSNGSEMFFAFSKEAFLGNSALPQSFRKIQKAYGANNAFMNTIDDYVASSFSNCHSASKVSPNPISCYRIL